mgnify:CR=1 FL=1
MAEPFLPDMAMQKLIDRGVRVVACDMAIHFYSGEIAADFPLATRVFTDLNWGTHFENDVLFARLAAA